LPDTVPDALPGSGQAAPWPRVSIVTPSYNQGQFIEETIRSVLLQGYPNLEYIIIDGDSTDSSVDVIREYEPWLTYWVSEPDNGQSEALNKGFARTTGTILTWLNSDDRFQPGAIQAGVEFLQDHPDVGIVYGNCAKIDENSRLIGTFPTSDFDLRRHLVVDLIPQPAALFRCIVWEEIGPLNTQFHYIMDYDLWSRAALHFSIVHIPILMADMRLHASSKTVDQTVRFMDELETLFDAFFALPDITPEIKAVEAEARGANYFSMGREYLRTKQYQKARQAFVHAWRTYPLNLNKLIMPPFWLDSVLRTNIATPLFRLAVWLKHGIWLPDGR
jgi:glycosyltransferase involved in cell wall biosynthesis